MEEWKRIERFPMYEISNLGRLRSYHRGWNGRICSINFATTYPSYLFSKDGKKTSIRIHTLVACTFLGPRPEGMYVCHKDGDRTNNRLDNLYYGTPIDNCNDTLTHGNRINGTSCHLAKLTDRKVKIIRGLHKCGFTVTRLCEIFGMSRRPIYSVIRRESWAHVE